MKYFPLFVALLITTPIAAKAVAVQSFRCQNAWQLQVDVALLTGGEEAYLAWSLPSGPDNGGSSEFRDAVVVEDIENDTTWFRFHDGYLAIERAFTEALELTAVATVKLGERTMSYDCIRQ